MSLAIGPTVIIAIVLFVVATSTKNTKNAIASSAPLLPLTFLVNLCNNQSIPPKYSIKATRPPTITAITAISSIAMIPSPKTEKDSTIVNDP